MMDSLEIRRLFSAAASLSADGTLSVGGTPGDDVITFTRGNRRLVVDFGAGGATPAFRYSAVKRIVITGGDGDDRIEVGPRDVPCWIVGGRGDDTLFGSRAGDVIDGGRGDDLLTGGDGDDFLNGGRGDGDDRFVGGDGADTVRGGGGRDASDPSSLDDSDAEEINSSFSHDSLHQIRLGEASQADLLAIPGTDGPEYEAELIIFFTSGSYGARVAKLDVDTENMSVLIDLSSSRRHGQTDHVQTSLTLRVNVGHLPPGDYVVRLAQSEFATTIGGLNVLSTSVRTVPPPAN